MVKNKKKKIYHGKEACEKFAEKLIKSGWRLTIPKEPYSKKSAKVVSPDYPLPKDYRELLTPDEKKCLFEAVPGLTDAGFEAILRRVYNMGDKRIRALTYEDLFGFCRDYIKVQAESKNSKQQSNEHSNRIPWVDNPGPEWITNTEAIQFANKKGNDCDVLNLQKLNANRLNKLLRKPNCTIQYMSTMKPKPRGCVHKANWVEYIKYEVDQKQIIEDQVEKEIRKRG